MKITRQGKNKELKKFCIYIWQEKNKDGVNTFIDHIGDEELLKELQLSI